MGKVIIEKKSVKKYNPKKVISKLIFFKGEAFVLSAATYHEGYRRWLQEAAAKVIREFQRTILFIRSLLSSQNGSRNGSQNDSKNGSQNGS